MSEELHRSPRVIGFLATEEGCPRCAWWLDVLHYHPPFEHPMPGLMFGADAAEKPLFEEWVREGTIPSRLKPFDNLVDVLPNVSYKKFTAYHPSGLWLHGIPDAMATREDDSLVILDHKSAIYKGADDPFMPQYEMQLTGYAWIAETLYSKDVSGAALIYWEHQAKSVKEDPSKYSDGQMLFLPLKPTLHEVTCDYKLLAKLAKAYVKIITSKAPPEGKTGCKNCAALEYLCEIHARLAAELKKRMQDATIRLDPALIYLRNVLLHDFHKARFSGLEGWLALESDEVAPAWV